MRANRRIVLLSLLGGRSWEKALVCDDLSLIEMVVVPDSACLQVNWRSREDRRRSRIARFASVHDALGNWRESPVYLIREDRIAQAHETAYDVR